MAGNSIYMPNECWCRVLYSLISTLVIHCSLVHWFKFIINDKNWGVAVELGRSFIRGRRENMASPKSYSKNWVNIGHGPILCSECQAHVLKILNQQIIKKTYHTRKNLKSLSIYRTNFKKLKLIFQKVIIITLDFDLFRVNSHFKCKK